jgi:hypothetical protein
MAGAPAYAPAMTALEIQITFQALSSLAIAGGLLYTALQFRKQQRATHFSNFSNLVQMQMHLREMRVNDPALASVYKHDVDYALGIADPIEAKRAVREYFFNLMQLSVFEIVWFGYTQEQVPEDYFRSWEKRMKEIAAEPSFRAMWGSPSMKIMHDEFMVYMRTLVDTTPVAGGISNRQAA